MTPEYSTGPAVSDQVGSSTRPLGRWALLVGTPLLLGALFLIHPDGTGGLAGLLPVGDRWLFLHVAMLPLLGLLGVSFYVLLQGHSGTVATVGRVGVTLYMTFYVSFEAIAGVTTGLLVHEAQSLPPAQQAGVAAAIEALAVPSMAIGVLGALGGLVAIAAAGVVLRRSGAPLVPVVLLGGAPLATVFHGGFPLDALAMAAFLAGIVWLELGWRGSDETTPARTT